MPQYQQDIGVSEFTTPRTLQLAYGCFQQLGWLVEFATENRLIGYTKKTSGSHSDHIIVEVENGLLTVTSKLAKSTSIDLLKKNKKNVSKFVSCFESMKGSVSEESLEGWKVEVESLKKHTEEAIVQEAKDAAEIDAVMNLSKGSKAVTYSVIGINVLVFLLMIINRVSIFEPTVGDIVKWGGNFKPYTTGGEWWRLITAMFVHIGIIHIGFNMYALIYVGRYLEPMLGKWRYAVAYLCTGVFASIASIWWSKDIVSAGASGAIFGLYGVFFALLTTKLIPAKMRSSLLSSIGIFIGYNLLYGAGKQGIDNAAHVGGLLSGFVIGYVYVLSYRLPKFRPVISSALVAAVTIVLTVAYLQQSDSDDLAYQRRLEKFGPIEDEALRPLRTPNDDSLLYRLTHVSQSKWQDAKKLMDETSNFHLDTANRRQRNLLRDYILLRIQQTDLLILSLQQHHDSDVEKDLKDVSRNVQEKIEELQKH
jgi:rhomboid protease GluP